METISLHFILFIVCLVVMAAYLFFMLYLAVRLKRTTHSPKEKTHPQVCVVVAFRNEEANLPTLISMLAAQTYPAVRFILVDDHSSDHGFTSAKSLIENDSRFQLFSQTDGYTGKKAALELGTQHADAEYFIFTDADCHVSHDWVASMVTAMIDENLDLCSAPVFISNPGTWVERLQAVETAHLTGVGHALIAFGKPVLCNGANLAANGSLASVPLKNNIASGDDIFRLQYAVKHKKRIGYTTVPDSHVFTPAEKTLWGWINQRIRWAGKSKYYTDPFSLGFTFFVGLVQLTALISLFVLQPALWAFLWGIKTLAEVIFITKVMNTYSQKFSFFLILSLGVAYPFFSVGIALFSFFVSPDWKGRRV